MKLSKSRGDGQTAKISPSEFFKCISFSLKIIHRAAPGFLLITGTANAVNGFRSAITNVILLRYVVNSAQKGESFQKIALTVVFVMALQLILNAVAAFFTNGGQCTRFYEKNTLRIRAYLDKMLTEKARGMDYAAYESPEDYDKYFKAREGSLDRIMAVFAFFTELCHRIPNISTAATVIFQINPVIAIFSLLPAASSILIKKANDISYAASLERKKHRRAQDYTMRTFYLVDFVKEMRTGGFAELMKSRFAKEIDGQDKVIRRNAPKLTALYASASFLQEILVPNGAVAYAVYEAGAGRMLYGDCLVIINSLSSVSYGIIDIFLSFTNLLAETLYIKDICAFLEAKAKIADKPDAKPVKRGDFEFKNVSFTYLGASSPTIKNLSFTVRDGEKVALVGQNGAGKTTIAKLMLRLYDPDEGEILYNGVNIKDLKLAEYRNAFSVVFQDFKNLSATVGENILMHPIENESEKEFAKAAALKADFGDKLSRMPKGIDTILTREFDDGGENLSGGESQKLALARIFANPGYFAILDEPTSALDPVAEYHMYENMMDACKNCSLVFVSHRLSSAVLADKVILLENGTAVEVGTHSSLMERGGKYAEMFTLQAEKYRESEVSRDGEKS